MNFGDHGLSRVDSTNFYSIAISQSLRMPDLFGLNMSFSVGPSNSRFDLNRQPTNMSQMSVGGFKMQKDIGINQNGEVILSTFYETNHNNNNGNNPNNSTNGNHIDYGGELDSMMFDRSINVSKPLDSNQLQTSVSENDANHNKHVDALNDLPCNMTNSQEMDPQQKSVFKSLMGKSRAQDESSGIIGISSCNGGGINTLLGESASITNNHSNNRMTNMLSLNLTQFHNESFSKFGNGLSISQSRPSNFAQPLNQSMSQMQMSQLFNNRHSLFPISLIDKKMETRSEPDIDVAHMDAFIEDLQSQQSFAVQKGQEQKAMTTSGMQESTGNFGMTIEPFVYAESQTQQQQIQQQQQMQHLQYQHQNHQYDDGNISKQFAHSDDEGTTTTTTTKLNTGRKKASTRFMQSPVQRPVDNKRGDLMSQNNGGASSTAAAKYKGSQYRQSRHKNVFKNFGGTLVRFIIYNSYFQERVIQELDKDAQKQKAFHDWLQNNVKLERKKDFQIAWTTFKTDSDTIRQYKALLRELSKDFFENFSFIYLINSKKISDMEIHLRSIHTYLAAINQPDSLERFKPV